MRISISLLLVFFLVALKASNPLPTERQFDSESMQAYQDDPAFDYSTDYAQSDALITLLLVYILDKIGQFFEVTGSAWLLPYLFRALVVVVMIWLIYFILKNRYGTLFVREGRVISPVSAMVSNERQVNYDQLIEKSLNDQAYRMAIRYLFLKSLTRLHDRKEVQITTWKAPFDYLKELKPSKQSSYNELVNIFESTWYGDYDADEEIFGRSSQLAQNLDHE